MNTGLVACAMLLAAAGSAMGSLQTVEGPISYSGMNYRLTRSGHLQERPQFSNDREPIVDIYNNDSVPAAGGNAGAGNYLGDELLTTGVGDIREFEFSVFNPTGTGSGPLTRVDIDIQFYETSAAAPNIGDYTLLGTLTFNDVSFGAGIPAGSFTTLTLTDPGISLSQTTIIAAVRFYDVVGTLVPVSQIRSNSPTVGSSANDLVVGNTTGITGFAAFASNNNLLYRVAVPAPGSLALLGLGGLVAGRRRR